MQRFGVIMAGGGGTRFWPLSRIKKPKQLLNLSGKDLMINEAVDRLSSVCASNNVFVITNELQRQTTVQVTQNRIPPNNVLTEPSAKNTAACIGYAAVKLLKTYGDGIMVITPSDAYVKNVTAFAEVLETAIAAAENSQSLVTVGIKPTFAATGYGYLKFKEGKNTVKHVLQFVEKPDKTIAEKYLKSGNYLWNSGMFVWKISVILQKFKTLLPDIYQNLIKIYDAAGTPQEKSVVNEIYSKIPSVSIDYGIMEKADNVLVVPGDFGWSDVGCWDSFGSLHRADENGNITLGDALYVESKNCTVYTYGKPVVTVGVEDLVVVETPDAVLVCSKKDAQHVGKAVEILKAQGREELL